LDEKLIDELRHLTDQAEIQRRISKAGNEPHQGRRLGEQASNRSGRPSTSSSNSRADMVRSLS
jgi:hypothetical protein